MSAVHIRFVQLEDCEHAIEVSSLDQWMSTTTDQHEDSVQLKACPICKTTIRRNLRYGAIIKTQLSDIENVKVRHLPLVLKMSEDVPLVEFIYLVFTRMPGECYRRRLRSLLHTQVLVLRISSAD